MRKVKYVPPISIKYTSLTEGWIYEVMSYSELFIDIINDRGVIDNYHRADFQDVTTEYRTAVIDEILS